MSITISPSLQATIEKQKNPTLKTNVQQQNTVLAPKPEIIENSKKINKKSKYILIGLGVAAAVAAIAFAATKGKTFFIDLNAKKALKYSEKIKNESDGIIEKADGLKNKVTELFQNNGMVDGEQIAKITENADGSKLMQEFASDGSTLRNSTFVNDVLSLIEEPTEKGKNVYEFFDGKLGRYSEALEELADGSKKAAKIFGFMDGKLSRYAKNYEELADGSVKYAKRLYFEDGKLSEYHKGGEYFADGSIKIAKTLFFEDGKLSEYQKGREIFADGSEKIAKALFFEDGKLLVYQKRSEAFADGSEKTAKWLYFEDGKLSEYQKGREYFADGSVKTAKTIGFEPGKPFKNLLIFIKSFFKKES